MRKIYMILLMVFAISQALSAQQNNQDVVYLKNGNIVKGIIIEQISNVSLKIQTADKSIFVFKIDEIEKVGKEELPVIQNTPVVKYETPQKEEYKRKGFSFIWELFSTGYGSCTVDIKNHTSQKLNVLPLGMQFYLGYQFNPYISFGVGPGIEYIRASLNGSGSGSLNLDLLADLRVYFLKTKVTPFVDLAGGYLSSFNFDSGMPNFNPGVGVKIFTSPRSAIHLSVGYRYMSYSGSEYIYRSNYTFTEKFNMFSFKFGFTF